MGTHSQVNGNKFPPRVLARVAQGINAVYPADVRTLGVDGARLVSCIVVPARAVATVQKARFVAHVDVLAAQAALGAGECIHKNGPKSHSGFNAATVGAPVRSGDRVADFCQPIFGR